MSVANAPSQSPSMDEASPREDAFSSVTGASSRCHLLHLPAELLHYIFDIIRSISPSGLAPCCLTCSFLLQYARPRLCSIITLSVPRHYELLLHLACYRPDLYRHARAIHLVDDAQGAHYCQELDPNIVHAVSKMLAKPSEGSPPSELPWRILKKSVLIALLTTSTQLDELSLIYGYAENSFPNSPYAPSGSFDLLSAVVPYIAPLRLQRLYITSYWTVTFHVPDEHDPPRQSAWETIMEAVGSSLLTLHVHECPAIECPLILAAISNRAPLVQDVLLEPFDSILGQFLHSYTSLHDVARMLCAVGWWSLSRLTLFLRPGSSEIHVRLAGLRCLVDAVSGRHFDHLRVLEILVDRHGLGDEVLMESFSILGCPRLSRVVHRYRDPYPRRDSPPGDILMAEDEYDITSLVDIVLCPSRRRIVLQIDKHLTPHMDPPERMRRVALVFKPLDAV